MFFDGVKDSEPGVGGCSGPEGAKEKRLPGLAGSWDEDAGTPKVNGFGAGASSGTSFALSAMTSSTILETSAEGFLGVAVGVGAAFADVGTKVGKEKGELVLEEDRVGVNPVPGVGFEVVAGFGSEKLPTVGMEGAARAVPLAIFDGSLGLCIGFEPSGRHPDPMAVSMCFRYCSASEGSTSDRSTKESPSTVEVRNDSVAVFKPRMVV